MKLKSPFSILTLSMPFRNAFISAIFSFLMFSVTTTSAQQVGATPPVGFGGPDRTVSEGERVQLNPGEDDSVFDNSAVSYKWSQVDNGAERVDLDNADTISLSFTAPPTPPSNLVENVILLFELVVTLNGIPREPDSVTVTVNATAGGGTATTFTQIPAQTMTVADGAQKLTVTSNFDDKDVPNSADLTYTAMSATETVAMVSITDVGVLTITPVMVGASLITVTAQDNSKPSVSQTFTVTVESPTTDSPTTTVGMIDSQTLTVVGGVQKLTVTGNFADPDVFNSEGLTYIASSAAPNKVSVMISTVGFLTITPVMVGTSVITVTAQEDSKPAVSQTFTVTVGDSATTFTQIPAQSLTLADDAQELTVTGNFADADVTDSAPLTYTATSAAPNKVSVMISTGGVLTITPVAAGSSVITVTAKDGTNTPVTQTFTVTVTVGDSATTFTQIPAQSLTLADGAQELTVTGNFADADVPNSAGLTYTAMSATEAVATVSITDVGVLTITPVMVGTSVITVMAKQGTNTAASQTFTVTVGDSATTFTQIPAQSLTVLGGAQEITVSDFFVDADVIDSADLTYTASSSNTSVATVSISITETGVLTTITPVMVGTSVVITVTAQEGSNDVASQTFRVTVKTAEANAGADQTVNEGDTVSLSVSSSGTGINPLYVWEFMNPVDLLDTSIADGIRLRPANNVASLYFTAPTQLVADAVLELRVTVFVGGHRLSDTVTITVIAGPNDVPEADAGPDRIVPRTGTVILDGRGSSDPENETLTYAWTQTGTTGTLTGEATDRPSFTLPTGATVGDVFEFSLIVTDARTQASAADTVRITVTDKRGITASSNSIIVTVGSAITPVTITSTGGEGLSYAISPDLPDGLVLDSVTGTISGTPVEVASEMLYTITASNTEWHDAITVTITVNAIAGYTVTPTTLTIDESSTGTYTVVMNTVPSGDVTVTPSSDNATDITFYPATLIFTMTNFATEQTITVSGVEDDGVADDRGTISHVVTGADYGGITVASVTVTIIDNDAVVVSETDLSITEGADGSGTYTVVLTSAPSGDVTVTPSSNNRRLHLMPATLTFTADNFATEQTIMVSGAEDDDAVDDTGIITHTVSGYPVSLPPRLYVTVDDDDTAGVMVTPTTLTIAESGSGTYTVALTSAPSDGSGVTIVLSSSNDDITFMPATLTFAADNFDTEQTIMVTSVADDDAVDDTGTISHVVTGADYTGVPVASVAVTVTDDTVGVEVSVTTLTITEGGPDTYTIALNTAPSNDVTIMLSSNNTDITFVPAVLTFTADNFATVQIITVSGAEDTDAVDDIGIISHAVMGAEYTGIIAASVTVTVTDSATTFTQIPAQSLTLTGGAEDVTVSDFFVDMDVLDSTDLSYTAMSATTGVAVVSITEAGVLTITPVIAGSSVITVTARDGGNMVASQTFNVTVDNATTFTSISAQSLTLAGGVQTVDVSRNFADLDVPNSADLTYTASSSFDVGVSVSITQAGVLTLTPVSVGSFVITVTAQEGSNDVASQTFSVTVGDSATTFTQIDAQSLTVLGGAQEITVTDNFADADVPASADLVYTATSTITGVATATITEAGVLTITPIMVGSSVITVTADEEGNNTPASQTFTVTVGDDIEVSVTYPTILTIAEGGTGTYTIVLNTAPSGSVTITLVSSNTDITFTPATLIFTAANFATVQTITVSGAEDDDATNDMGTISHTVAGVDYGSVNAADVAITVTDSDAMPDIIASTASITVTVGSAITPLVIIDSSGGGTVISYEISPAISNGLAFDPATGTISGTPTQVASEVCYTITARNNNGTDTVDVCIIVDGMLGEEEFIKEIVTISPNPTTGILNITVVEKVDYLLLNIRGQVLKIGALTEGKNFVNISSLPKGIYLLNLKTSKGSFTRKIVRN